MTQWRLGVLNHPDLYPKRLDNSPKEAILRLISKGADPEDAFLTVLNTSVTTIKIQ